MIIKTKSLTESLEKKYNHQLNESYVDEWWGQTDDDPFEFAYNYNLTCTKLDQNYDETLYRFSGTVDDINKARHDGYFMSMQYEEDEGHSEDLDEACDTCEEEKEPLNEDLYDDVSEQVWKCVRDRIEDALDNIAMVVSSKIPDYNPDWCSELSSYGIYADKLADQITEELMFQYEQE